MRVSELVRWGSQQLAHTDSARLAAEVFAAHVLRLDRVGLITEAATTVAIDLELRYRELIAARADGRPVAQLVGYKEFWSLELAVDDQVLVPRPETELLVELALAAIPVNADYTVADLGTGSGAIAVALARERPRSWFLATDISTAALAIARCNILRHRLSNVALARLDWTRGLGAAKFDLIVSNPPYLAAGDPLLASTDIRFEPKLALASGPDGMLALRAISAAAPANLESGGMLLMEHGESQGAAVRAAFQMAGLSAIATYRDLAGHERVSCAYCG